MTIAANWAIEFSSGIPVYKQIINYIFAEIGNGNLRQGEQLPTIKELTEQLNVNPNTIAKAYRELDLKGVITSKRGNGSFISASRAKTLKPSSKARKNKLDEILGRLVAEAKAYGITEDELIEHLWERMNKNG